MLQSMTGFGKAKIEMDDYNFHVEVKSLNSKSADISIRLPRRFSDKELEIRNKLSHILDRGKINLSVDFELNHKQVELKSKVNHEVAIAYFQDLRQLAKHTGNVDDSTLFSQALKMQGVIQETQEDEVTEDESKTMMVCIDQAIEECKKFRADEGKVLHQTLKEYIQHIASLLEKVKIQDPLRLDALRSRITMHMQELVANDAFDKNRFEHEMIFYIEKLDISEEKVRLSSHLDYFIETMEKEETPGRKLGFIGQEIGREINTIGSKANDVVIQKLVVEMKDYLEKIKEQSLNIL